MKKYNFIIRKSSDMDVKITAKNHSEAMIKLLEKIVLKDKNFFIRKDTKKKEICIGIKKIIDENGKENRKYYDDFYEKNKIFLTKENKQNETNFVKHNDEIEDDLPKEYIEIVCDKCGNCIRIDDKDLFSE